MKKNFVVLLAMLFPVFAFASVASGSATHNERFTVTVMNAQHVVTRTLSGVTIGSHPLYLSRTKNTSYIAQINQKVKEKATTKEMFVTTGEMFTLTPTRHGFVHITGNVSHLIRMGTKNIQGKILQLPDVKTSELDDNVHLIHGQSVTLSMVHGFVKVTRI